MATIDAIYLHLEGANVAALEGELKDKEIGFVRGAAQGDARLFDSGTGYLQFAFREKNNTFSKLTLTDDILFETADEGRMQFVTGLIRMLAKSTNNIELEVTGAAQVIKSIVAGTTISTLKAAGLNLIDNKKLLLGTSDDLEAFHDGTIDSYIRDITTGHKMNVEGFLELNLKATSGDINMSTVKSASSIFVKPEGTLVTTWNTNEAIWEDNKKIFMGASKDLEIFADGAGNTYVRTNIGVQGKLNLEGNDDVIISATTGDILLKPRNTLIATHLLAGTRYEDNKKVTWGAGDDLTAYHDGANDSFIETKHTASDVLTVDGDSGLNLKSTTGNVIVDAIGGNFDVKASTALVYRTTVNELTMQATKILNTAPSTTARSGFRIQHGVAASTPVNGDIYTTTGGIFTRLGGGTMQVSRDSGTPEGNVTGSTGAIFMRTDGGAGTSFYIKESGTGNTGWVAK